MTAAEEAYRKALAAWNLAQKTGIAVQVRHRQYLKAVEALGREYATKEARHG